MAEPPTSTTTSGAPESRALTAALSGPAFETKTGGSAMHAATRHVERWAPEAGANRVRPLRNLGFVDRLVAPWLEVAQKSASLRLFQQYRSNGLAEREPSHVSWVFPRPWYQDELDWMTASREAAARSAQQQQAAPTLFTTRGTFVAPAQREQVALPGALYEHVAPSLSITPPARNDFAMPAALAAPTQRIHDAYSPLVPFAAVNAAQVMQRAVAPLIGTAATTMSPGLRSVLATMFQRSVLASEPTRTALQAPELVTPPAPRPVDDLVGSPETSTTSTTSTVADAVSAQRAQIAELQRATRVVAERQLAERTQQQVRAREEAVVQTQAQTVERQRAAEQASTTATATERARVEERIAQRLAERGREQRLHEAAREAAARDVQLPPAPMPEVAAPVEQRTVPTEITAALANLSPQLASMVASRLTAETLAQRPDRMAQTIGELGEALRNAELIARSAASGGSFEQTRGPRLVMPAGLGGLVATVDRNVAQGERRAQGMPFAPPAFEQTTDAPAAMRMPALAWLAAPGSAAARSEARRDAGTPAGALAATETARPAALQHIAWADRWLARFSGAKEASLDLLTAAAASPATRLQALADAAPGTVFVAPQLDHSIDDSPATVARREADAPVEVPPVRRYDDSEATPDDVFVAISRSAARVRAPIAEAPAERLTGQRASIADAVAHTVPVAPNAGMAAPLAASPFAPAFRHLFPVAAAPAFDVRALFGETLSASYLAGMLSPAMHEVVGGAAIGELPGFATLAASTPFAPIARDALRGPAEQSGKMIDFSPEYVAPSPERAQPVGDEATQQMIAPLTTMRSALLAWNVESVVTPQATAPTLGQSAAMRDVRIDQPTITALSPVAFAAQLGGASAQSMIDAMSLPLANEAMASQPGAVEAGQARVPSFGAPGMIADRAQAWSVAQERSAADLSFDFVTPELVLAARVYGLGPAEAAQAMRLAISGPGQLAAMASAVNRTFVQALAIEAAREQAGSHPSSTGATAPITAYPTSAAPAGAAPMALPAAATTFGVERKAPRGAFMWPSATVAALGLSAAAPDGDQGMPVAALELLAAQSVAALGTYAAFGFNPPAVTESSMTSAATSAPATSAPAPTALSPSALAPDAAVASEPTEADVLTSATAMVSTSRRAKFEAMYLALGQSSQARSWSPAAKAARALALAGRGDESITALERAQIAWSVLPLVAPTELGSALGGDAEPGAVLSTGAQSQRATLRRHVELQQEQLYAVESRPGLANLSARAGEALGSYVAPTAAPEAKSAGSSRDREQGAVFRAPTAAPDYVQTGSVGGSRSSGRFGGGEAQVPTWFEAAARKMLEERSAGMSGDISLAELTFVQAAPTTQIAASERGTQSAAPPVPSPSSAAPAHAAPANIDIEKVANEVYRHILTLMDAARARNGEPFL